MMIDFIYVQHEL